MRQIVCMATPPNKRVIAKNTAGGCPPQSNSRQAKNAATAQTTAAKTVIIRSDVRGIHFFIDIAPCHSLFI